MMADRFSIDLAVSKHLYRGDALMQAHGSPHADDSLSCMRYGVYIWGSGCVYTHFYSMMLVAYSVQSNCSSRRWTSPASVCSLFRPCSAHLGTWRQRLSKSRPIRLQRNRRRLRRSRLCIRLLSNEHNNFNRKSADPFGGMQAWESLWFPLQNPPPLGSWSALPGGDLPPPPRAPQTVSRRHLFHM